MKTEIAFEVWGIEAALIFKLKVPEGAVQLVVSLPRHNTPFAVDLGYHFHKPLYSGQPVCQLDCRVIGGPCFYDGSTLSAKEVWAKGLDSGAQVIWDELEKFYNRLKEDAAVIEEEYKSVCKSIKRREKLTGKKYKP